MIILKHVGHKIKNSSELGNLLNHLKETTSEVEGVSLKDIYFPKGKDEFILVLECISVLVKIDKRAKGPKGVRSCFLHFMNMAWISNIMLAV